ncbi:MAG TPA: class II fructose-bisphosphate aldolase [Candidatus Ratteibacteria bacterium]|uniref:D-tagatose-1,6-bisphosphate aldolase subunit KbaY n=1 Tax=candidate division TA06 bacterium ADurb.Bin131 TaxID=1852827 RepID=A0A1V6CCH5_UNCT6|nr:MAG: D-tagatose-1,6-bisphosphate aldolase subunit KbaY [candidate division TA06 bacterium ADurb.Bin131]HON05424.1 class II fructose-bisphosphate aldolase [bacterium]HPC29152.1 class II fructose-bisphosphate aldolase [bacterium]HRS05526.1 class II fructose-bisphosphate aldolase [Candidatus Ratteibacteria bacterium]HRV03605.1 class II fructose-bisphosphate aldolase [Candidatus Ratteibacteria bacterium]
MNKYMKISNIMIQAYKKQVAIPAFNAAYLDMIKPISDALKEYKTIGIIQVSKPDIENFGAKSIKAVYEEYIKSADMMFTFLHLDHVPVIDENFMHVNWLDMIEEGITLGFDSVMIDGSRLKFEENVNITKTVVRIAHLKEICVEAEIGYVFGHESTVPPPYEEIFAKKLGFTNVDEAARFVQLTGVDWLSVSTGSIHGAISGAGKDQKKIRAKLDIEHLNKLKEATKIPLVLHGGTGVEIEYIKAAVKAGITKINIGTEIRQAYENGIKNSQQYAENSVKETIKKIIEDFEIKGSADILNPD